MSDIAVVLVLAAALLHASWNAVLKAGGDQGASARLMIFVQMLCGVLLLPFAEMPAPASWPWLAVTATVHVVYWLALIDAYRHGDLSQVYPIARGSAPLLVTLGAALLADERPDWPMLLGIGLVCGGVLAMWRARGSGGRGIAMALLTAVTIATYSVADGIGVRLSGAPLGFIAWTFIGEGVLTLGAFALLRTRFRPLGARGRALAVAGGITSMVAYSIVIWAMSLAPIALVSALRESSVLFAVLLGWLFFGEPVGPRRIAACLAIAAGAALLALVR
jgi:drug/metabolite transporter (DMT)-like permease